MATMMKRVLDAGRLCRWAGIALLWAGGAHAIVSTTNGVLTSGLGESFLDGVAKLAITRSDGNFGCSGSLLAGGAQVLTAAHCLSGETGTATTSGVAVSLLGNTVTASSISYVVNPGWNGSFTAGNDLAVINLTTPVSTVAGYSLYFSNVLDRTDKRIVLAGYGLTGNGTTGSVGGTFGTLRYGYNEYDNQDSKLGITTFNSTYLYDFDDGSQGYNKFGSSGLGATEVMIAPGDSGGPGLIQVGGQWYVAGVHSFDSCSRGTCPINSSFGEVGGDISVFGQMVWLQSVVTAVPEPESYAMMLTGLVLLATVVRRRRA